MSLTFFSPEKINYLFMYSQTCLQRSATGITKVAFVDRWPLFGALETTIRCSRDEFGLAFVDRKTLLAGVLMHRFHEKII